jgi:hypothetical protein
MTALEKTFIGAALVAAIGTGIFEAHQNSRLRDQLKVLQQEQQRTEHQLAALRASHTGDHFNVAGMASSKADSDTLPSNTVINEIERSLAESSWGGRDAAFERLGKLISLSDIPRALAFLAQRPDSNGVDTPLFTHLASRWGSENPDAAIAWANGLQGTNAQEQALVNIIVSSAKFMG